MYRTNAMMAKIILGIHTLNIGDIFALMAKVALTVWKRMYPKLRASPTPILVPIPFFLFSVERETPINVRIKAAKGMANRL